MVEEAKVLEQRLQHTTPDDCPPAAPATPASYDDINRTLSAAVVPRQPDPTTDPLAAYRSPKHSKPEVMITYCNMSGYWLVAIKCKDRSKLLFDTVCTLSDLDYDVFHATIDSHQGAAIQEYYIRYALRRWRWWWW